MNHQARSDGRVPRGTALTFLRTGILLGLTVLILSNFLSAAPRIAGQETGPTVEMRDFAFTPRDVTVTAGTTVRWVNVDDSPHAVAMEGGKPGSSQVIQPGQSHSFVFREPGTYTYRCGIHPTMLGEITVQGS